MKTKITFIICAMVLSAFVAGAQAPAPVIGGTPYLDEAFVIGEILVGNTVKKVPLRYNIYSDLIEYKPTAQAQALALDPGASVKLVKFNNSKYVVDKFEYRGKTKFGFLTLLDSGKATLMSKKVVTYMDVRKGGALDGTDLPAQFTRGSDIYFYKVAGGEVVKIDNIKKMVAGFPDKQDELNAFIKKEKISMKKEGDLVELFKYYNSL